MHTSVNKMPFNQSSFDNKRVPTGIPGFDELCEGGLLRNMTYLLSGTSGAGKTNFALQYLFNGIINYHENGIFVAMEERPEQIRENVQKLGLNIRAMEAEGKLAIIDACSTKIGLPSREKYVDSRPFDMRALMDQIIEIQEDIGAKRAVLDSTTSIGFHFNDASKLRIELLKLSTTLELLGLTSLLTCEIVDDTQPSRFGVENFVTEGTIMMYYKRHENDRVRSIEIYKMRGSNHSNKIHPYEIGPRGIVVHPNEEVYTSF